MCLLFRTYSPGICNLAALRILTALYVLRTLYVLAALSAGCENKTQRRDEQNRRCFFDFHSGCPPHFNILLSGDTIFALLEKAYSTLTLFDYCVAVSLRSVNLKIELF